MLTQDQVHKSILAGRDSKTIDGRDHSRLLKFFPESVWKQWGYKKAEGVGKHTPIPWKKEAIIGHLKADVAFGFEKALNCRGISAACMYEVVLMWMWILEDKLQHFDSYTMYGLPLFKAVALKYGFDNSIGDDVGNEPRYEDQY